MNMTKHRISTSLFCMFSMLLFSCIQTDGVEGQISRTDKISVLLGQPLNVTSRTSIADDGRTAEWASGDEIALWATDPDGNKALDGDVFTMWRFDDHFNEAVFTADIVPMPAADYTYHAVYPIPERMEGDKAHFTLASEQTADGFAGAYDILVAEPVSGGALTDRNINELGFNFKHKMHALKITIPQGANLFGMPVHRIDFEFASNVTGEVAVDITDPYAPASLINGSRRLTVNIPQGLSEGGSVWAMIFPADLSGEISYTAYSGINASHKFTTTISKVADEAHITPLSIRVPEPAITTISLSIGVNNLGEDVRTLSVVNENGMTLKTFNINSANVYNMKYNGSFDGAQFSGKTFTARFESDNAIVERKFTMPTVTAYETTTVAPIDVPYLLFEDFSGMTGTVDKNDGYVNTTTDQGVGGILLADNSLAGWNGSRIGGRAGLCVRINARYEGLVGAGRYCGRLDTPALSRLKSGSSVKLKVDFDAGYYYKDGPQVDDANNTEVAYMLAGVHTSAESQTLDGSNQNGIGNTSYRTPYFVNNYGAEDFDKTFPTYSFTVEGCSPSSRIVWWAATERQSVSVGGNSMYYYYIDNIRISIAK